MDTPLARLEVVAGKAAGMSILLGDELLIGRYADGAGRLAEDEEISRSHARVTLDACGFCAIEDLGSTNGTFVNGLRITGRQALSVGDTIELGETTLVVRELPQPPGGELSAPTAQETVFSVVGPTADAPPESVCPPEAEIAVPPTPGAGSPAAPEPAPFEAAQPELVPRESAPAASIPTGGPPPTLALRMEVDFAAGEVRISLDDASHSARLEFEGGAWHAVSSSG